MDEIDAENKNLKGLFEKWKEAVSFGDSFVEDGAVPGYYDKKLKILFLGRESYECKDRVTDGFYYGSFKNKAYQLVDMVAYGLLDGRKWSKLPDRKDIPRPPKGFSFAFVNVSKFYKEGSGLSPDFKNYVDESLGEKKSKRNFIREEIELLNPDLIISWNLRAKLGKKRFKKILTGDLKRECSPIKSCDFLPDRAWIYEGKGNREIPLLDTWCFASADWTKNAETDIYNPIMKAVKALVEAGILKPKQG